MTQPSLFSRHAWAVLLLAFVLAGCQSAMSNQSKAPLERPKGYPGEKFYTDSAADWPLRFAAHYFTAYCYSTYGCKVKYGNYRMEDAEDELQLSSASIAHVYPNNFRAGWGPIVNFPPPAVVTWRSSDGTPHRAEIDMDVIFKDQLIHHKLSREEIPETASISPPGIILEVNDRTINVYMQAHISTKELQEPGNRYSDFRNDLIKVFSQTH